MANDSYDELRNLLQTSDPRLAVSALSTPTPSQSSKATPSWKPWSRAKVRTIALDLSPGKPTGSPIEFVDAQVLAAHLQKVAESADSASRSVYILEGLSPDFVAVFGQQLNLHPSLFMDHERLVPCADRMTGENGGLPSLPSAIMHKDHVALKYHEPLSFSKRPTSFRCVCETSGRHIAITRLMGKFSNVGIARRKCTVWSTTTKAGGWTSLIICDPPIARLLADPSGILSHPVKTLPYEGGHIDFRPLTNQMKTPLGPPRTSLLSDILFYTQHLPADTDLSTPLFLRAIVEKLIASHYLKLSRFLQTNVEKVQWHFSRKQDLASFDISTSEEQWSDVQAWERRLAEYQDDLEAIMVQLRVPLDHSSHLPPSSPGDCSPETQADFSYLFLRYRELQTRITTLSTAVTTLANLASTRAVFRTAAMQLKEAEAAGRGARSVKVLTTLGLIFLPLSFAASIFSMAEEYAPGGARFWVYFAVAFPLLAVAVLVNVGAELGFGDSESGWSFGFLWGRIRGWFC